MAIDTKNERLSIIGWPGANALADPDHDMDKEDRLIMIGLPAVDAAPHSYHTAPNNSTGLGFGFLGLGGAGK
jgi:hypothetical protein